MGVVNVCILNIGGMAAHGVGSRMVLILNNLHLPFVGGTKYLPGKHTSAATLFTFGSEQRAAEETELYKMNHRKSVFKGDGVKAAGIGEELLEE